MDAWDAALSAWLTPMWTTPVRDESEGITRAAHLRVPKGIIMSTSPFLRPRRTAALLAAGAVAAGTVSLAFPATPAQAAGWTAPHTLTADNSGFRTMKILSTGAGDALAVWIDGDSGEDRVRAQVATDGVWGQPTWVSPQGIATDYVEVEANNAGDVVATWLSEDDGVNWKAPARAWTTTEPGTPRSACGTTR